MASTIEDFLESKSAHHVLNTHVDTDMVEVSHVIHRQFPETRFVFIPRGEWPELQELLRQHGHGSPWEDVNVVAAWTGEDPVIHELIAGLIEDAAQGDFTLVPIPGACIALGEQW